MNQASKDTRGYNKKKRTFEYLTNEIGFLRIGRIDRPTFSAFGKVSVGDGFFCVGFHASQNEKRESVFQLRLRLSSEEERWQKRGREEESWD